MPLWGHTPDLPAHHPGLQNPPMTPSHPQTQQTHSVGQTHRHTTVKSKCVLISSCHGTTSLLSFLVFVCPLPHLCHLLTPSDLVRLPSAASAPTPRCTHATMLHLCSD